MTPGPKWKMTNDKWKMENASQVSIIFHFPFSICHHYFSVKVFRSSCKYMCLMGITAMIGLNDLKSDLAPGSLLLRERQPARRRMDSVKHRICWGYQLSLSQLLHPPVGKRRVRLRSDIYTFLQLLSL